MYFHTRAGQSGQDGESQDQFYIWHHFQFGNLFCRLFLEAKLDCTVSGERLWAISQCSVHCPFFHSVSLFGSLKIELPLVVTMSEWFSLCTLRVWILCFWICIEAAAMFFLQHLTHKRGAYIYKFQEFSPTCLGWCQPFCWLFLFWFAVLTKTRNPTSPKHAENKSVLS